MQEIEIYMLSLKIKILVSMILRKMNVREKGLNSSLVCPLRLFKFSLHALLRIL